LKVIGYLCICLYHLTLYGTPLYSLEEMSDLSRQAIDAALAGNWQLALDLNLKIVKEFGEEPHVLNRIARSYCELGEIEKAKKHAKKVLLMDPFNTIAAKSLEKWSELKNGHTHNYSIPRAQTFLEEPGKTKVITLRNLGDRSVLVSLDCGDALLMRMHGHGISFENQEGKHIGKLPDDIANRLKKLVKEGNEYVSYVKCANPQDVKVFMREMKRAKHVSHIASFPTEKMHYVAFAAPELLHDKKGLTAPSA
jgi:tetratricopeptide (TPR) repeat protein